MKMIKVIVVGLAAIFFITSAAYAQPMQESQEKQEKQEKREGRGEKKDQLFKELNLTPEQRQQLEENRKAQREEMLSTRKAMEKSHAKLQEAMKDPAVTKSTVEPIVNEMKALQAKMIDGRIDGIFAVKQILTPEQFAKFQQIMEKKKEDGKERFRQKREERKEYHNEW